MTPIQLDLTALGALGDLSPARRRRLAVTLLAALSISPEDLTSADEAHAAALARIRELTSEVDAATDRAERAEAALESASSPLSVLSAGGVAAVALADLSPLDTGDPGECEPTEPPEPEILPTPVADYLEELDPQLREAFSDLHDLACAAGLEPEAEITGIDCPEHDLGAIGVTLRILGLLLFLWRSGALSGLLGGADAAASPDALAASEAARSGAPPNASEAAPLIAVEQPRATADLPGPASGTGGLSLTADSGQVSVTRSESVDTETAPAISPAPADPYSQGMDDLPDPPALSSSVDALLLASSSEPDALSEADLEPLDLEPVDPPLQGDRLTGWRLIDQATDAAGALDTEWLAGALQTAQDGADLLAALGASALLPISAPAVSALDSDDRADLVALVEERLGQSRAWGMIWGDAGDGYAVARPWVYLQSSEAAREQYLHRVEIERWPEARLAWVDLEAATTLLLRRRETLLAALYLDPDADPPTLRPARTGAGNLGAHVSQLGTAEICALARVEAPGLVGLGSPAGWPALYAEDDRARIAYQRVKGHRDHLAISRRASAEADTADTRSIWGKLWGRE